MRIYLLIVPFLFFASCSSLKPGCLIQDKIANVAADAITAKLQCQNPLAVLADVEGVVNGLGLCKTGPIADTLCPMVSSEIVEKLVPMAVPATWQCSAQEAKATLKTAITNACKLLPVKK